MPVKNFFLSLLIIVSITACDKGPNSNNDAINSNAVPLYLNDSGMDQYTQNFPQRLISDPAPVALSSAIDSDAPGQDADRGQDSDPNNSDNDGHGGFKFAYLDANGNLYSVPPSNYATDPWSCVLDKTTGLIWEVKTLSGLQARDNTYTWYNTDAKTYGGNVGFQSQGDSQCRQTLSNCNTEDYIAAINAMNNGKGLCGLNNWRLPLREELRSILDYSVTNRAMVDSNFFPNAAAGDTWTAQTAYYSDISGTDAWEMHFDSGYSEKHTKSAPDVHVRLVHSPVN